MDSSCDDLDFHPEDIKRVLYISPSTHHQVQVQLDRGMRILRAAPLELEWLCGDRDGVQQSSNKKRWRPHTHAVRFKQDEGAGGFRKKEKRKKGTTVEDCR